MKILILCIITIISFADNKLIIGENNLKTLNIYNNITFMQEQQNIDFNNINIIAGKINNVDNKVYTNKRLFLISTNKKIDNNLQDNSISGLKNILYL